MLLHHTVTVGGRLTQRNVQCRPVRAVPIYFHRGRKSGLYRESEQPAAVDPIIERRGSSCVRKDLLRITGYQRHCGVHSDATAALVQLVLKCAGPCWSSFLTDVSAACSAQFLKRFQLAEQQGLDNYTLRKLMIPAESLNVLLYRVI